MKYPNELNLITRASFMLGIRNCLDDGKNPKGTVNGILDVPVIVQGLYHEVPRLSLIVTGRKFFFITEGIIGIGPIRQRVPGEWDESIFSATFAWRGLPKRIILKDADLEEKDLVLWLLFISDLGWSGPVTFSGREKGKYLYLPRAPQFSSN